MKHLPTDILIIIFKYLHYEQKLECMFVCRKFAQILGDGYLFETMSFAKTSPLDMHYYDYRMYAAIDKAKSSPNYGKKCKRFLTNTSFQNELNIPILARAFPNLTFLCVSQKLNFNKAFDESSEGDPFEGWKDHLETLDIRDVDVPSCNSFLKQGVFKRLSTIEIKMNPIIIYPMSFSLFINTPALTSLSLEGISGLGNQNIHIRELEVLHNNTPALTSLTITQAYISDLPNLHYLNIKPAENMKSLRLKNIKMGLGQKNAFLTYILLKYPHLDEFVWPDWDNKSGISNAVAYIKSEWNDLLSSIGPRLRVCRITGLHESTNTLDLIARYTVQLENLFANLHSSYYNLNTILTEPAFSNLRALSLKHVPSNFKLSDLKTFVQLKELTLDVDTYLIESTKISLNILAKELPRSIETLVLKEVFIAVEELDLDESSNIAHLKLYRTCGRENISAFLTLNFPKLKSLSLDACLLPGPIELPNHHLDLFEYKADKQVEMDKEMNFQLTISGRTLYYRTCFDSKDKYEETVDYKGDRPLQNVRRSYEGNTNSQYFHFVCASVETVYFNDAYLLF